MSLYCLTHQLGEYRGRRLTGIHKSVEEPLVGLRTEQLGEVDRFHGMLASRRHDYLAPPYGHTGEIVEKIGNITDLITRLELFLQEGDLCCELILDEVRPMLM